MNIYDLLKFLLNTDIFTGVERTMALVKLCNFVTLDYIKYLATEKYNLPLKDAFEKWYKEEGAEDYEIWESMKEEPEVDA